MYSPRRRTYSASLLEDAVGTDALDFDGDDYVKDKRGLKGVVRQGTTKFVKIPESFIGKVIGKGGVTIKSIRSQSGAYLSVKDGVIDIRGEADQIKRAERLIENIIGHNVKTKVIRVGHNQIGILIGAKGVNIKKIQTTSGALVKLEDQAGGPHGNGDARVEISGTEEQIKMAEKMIQKSISNVVPETIMTVSADGKLILKQMDKQVKEKDLLDLYPDAFAHSIPKIMIRAEKGGVGIFATLTFGAKCDSTIWMNQLKGQMLAGRRIILKKS